jgi:choline dehydrogenase-like flavoprotein
LENVVQELQGKFQNGDIFFDVDAVIVGSGCGGGVVAHQLVNAGFRVLVLEKGGFYQTDDFAKWKECDAFTHAFDKGGLCTSADGSVVILAGSCVGGGSTVNWSASFVPPKHVLDDWVDMGLTEFR